MQFNIFSESKHPASPGNLTHYVKEGKNQILVSGFNWGSDTNEKGVVEFDHP
jgi:hypothetical protein